MPFWRRDLGEHSSGLSFRRRDSGARRNRRSVKWMAALALIVGGLIASRSLWQPRASEGILVEVRGEVAAPGVHHVDPPTLSAALLVAGASERFASDTRLREGDLVRVTPTGVQISPSRNALLVGLPVNINHGNVEALQGIPGVGKRTAEAIVLERDLGGPFYDVVDLERVPNLGTARVLELSHFITVGEMGPRPPLDINRANAHQLQRLDGIGPVLAQRIVQDRYDLGFFPSLKALSRVPGVGAQTVKRLREQGVVARSPASDSLTPEQDDN